MMYFRIDLVILVAAILTGFSTYTKNKAPYLYFMPFFLFLTLLVELSGHLFEKRGQNNLPLYNLFSVVEFSFFTYFFKEVMPANKVKKIITLIQYLLPVGCLVNIFLIQGIHVFHTYTYVMGCIVMVGLGMHFFYQLFSMTDKKDLLKEPSFWISIAVLFFFICSVSLIGAFNYVAFLPDILRNNLRKILVIVNSFFYFIFIVAFLCQINIRKSLSRL